MITLRFNTTKPTVNQAAAAQDLRAWAQQTGQRLPMTAQEIADLEAAGWLVDLETGETTRYPDADNFYHNN